VRAIDSNRLHDKTGAQAIPQPPARLCPGALQIGENGLPAQRTAKSEQKVRDTTQADAKEPEVDAQSLQALRLLTTRDAGGIQAESPPALCTLPTLGSYFSHG
jgi:hypothetical protein